MSEGGEGRGEDLADAAALPRGRPAAEPSWDALGLPDRSPLDRGALRFLVVAVGAGLALFVWTLLVDAERRSVAAPGGITVEAMEKRLMERPQGVVVILAAKILPAIAGLVVLLMHLDRRSSIRKGLLPPPVPPARIGFRSTATALVVALVVTLAFGERVWTALRGPSASGTTRDGILTTAIVGIVIGLAIVGVRAWRARGGPVLPLRRRLGAALRVFLVSALLTFVLGYAAVLVLKGVFSLDPAPQDLVRQLIESDDRQLVAWVAVYGVLAAPFVEEAVFRGLLYPAVRRFGGRTAAALWVSILFAAVHVDAYAYLPLLGLSLLLVGLFEATDSVLAVTLVHALNNLSSMVPILVMRGGL